MIECLYSFFTPFTTIESCVCVCVADLIKLISLKG